MIIAEGNCPGGWQKVTKKGIIGFYEFMLQQTQVKQLFPISKIYKKI